MNHILSIFLVAPPPGGESNMLGLLLPMVVIFFIMYLFMIRPQVKKQKKHQAMLEALGKGDKVVTSGGIYGKIVEKKEHSFLVEIAPKIKIEVQKTAIGRKAE